MINIGLEFYLTLGAILMSFLTAKQTRLYGFATWKSVIVTLGIIVTGLLSCEVWFFFENGFWGGRSFFGAIFFAPITFVLISRITRIPYLFSLDYCATSGCLILAILKIDCLIGGCCKGVVLFQRNNQEFIRFPCQLMEIVTALMLTIALFKLSKEEKYRGKIYPIALVAYGIIRFVLNLFRDDWDRAESMNLLLPLGCIWSLLAVVLGMTMLIMIKKYEKHILE